MSALGELLRDLANGLGPRRWYLFGAQAVNVWARPRSTADVDVTVELGGEDPHALSAALDRAGFGPRFGPGDTERLLRTAAVLPLVHRATGRDLDLVVAGAGLEALALDRAIAVDVEGVAVPVICPTDLVVTKILAGRSKDLEDVRALLAAADVHDDEVTDLLRQLEEALSVSDLLPAWEAARRGR